MAIASKRTHFHYDTFLYIFCNINENVSTSFSYFIAEKFSFFLLLVHDTPTESCWLNAAGVLNK